MRRLVPQRSPIRKTHPMKTGTAIKLIHANSGWMISGSGNHESDEHYRQHRSDQVGDQERGGQ